MSRQSRQSRQRGQKAVSDPYTQGLGAHGRQQSPPRGSRDTTHGEAIESSRPDPVRNGIGRHGLHKDCGRGRPSISNKGFGRKLSNNQNHPADRANNPIQLGGRRSNGEEDRGVPDQLMARGSTKCQKQRSQVTIFDHLVAESTKLVQQPVRDSTEGIHTPQREQGKGAPGLKGERIVSDRTHHNPSMRDGVVTQSIKPGKRRFGPTKKKLSVLKKRILLDRAEKWRLLFAQTDADTVMVTKGIPSETGSTVGIAQGATVGLQQIANGIDHGKVESIECSSQATNPLLAKGSQEKDVGTFRSIDFSGKHLNNGHIAGWKVSISNLVTEEDIEDDDEYEEIVKDTIALAGRFSQVTSVSIPRKGEDGVGMVIVGLSSKEEAEATVDGLHGLLVGGLTLSAVALPNQENGDGDSRKQTLVSQEVQHQFYRSSKETILTDVACGESDAIGTCRGGERDKWVVKVINLVSGEDVEDDDEHAEIVDNVTVLAKRFGRVASVYVPRGGEDGVGTAMVEFTSLADAECAVQGLHSLVVAGQTLEAVLETGTVGSSWASGAIGKGEERKWEGNGAGTNRSGNGGYDGRKGAHWCSDAMVKDSVATSRSNNVVEGLREGEATNIGRGIDENRGHWSSKGCSIGNCEGWYVTVKNLVNEGDLEEDDEYEEVCRDVVNMIGTVGGQPLLLDIPRMGDSRMGTVFAKFRSGKEAGIVAEGLCLLKVGGKLLKTEVLCLPPGASECSSEPLSISSAPLPLPYRRAPLTTDKRGVQGEHTVESALGPISNYPHSMGKDGMGEELSVGPGESVKGYGMLLGEGGQASPPEAHYEDTKCLPAAEEGKELLGIKRVDGVAAARAVVRSAERGVTKGGSGKYFPHKYREAADLPKFPLDGSTREYVNQVGKFVWYFAVTLYFPHRALVSTW
ncbi:unnamed protein product [Choristocarpus tenellus]